MYCYGAIAHATKSNPYYEQEDLYDHEGVDVEDGQTTSTVEGKENNL